MGSGFETSQTGQTTNSAPWGAQKGYLKDIYARAQGLSNTPLQQFPGEMVAPQDAATVDAQAAAEARARSGSPLLGQSQQYTSDVLQGNYLNSNPYSDAQYDKIAAGVRRNFNDAVLPAIATRYGTSGMIGSSNEQNAYGAAGQQLGQSLGDAAVDFYGNQYNQERGYQENARAAAPGLAQADYQDIGQLGQVGAQREDRAQQLINEAIGRFDFTQQEPWQRLGQYAGLIGGAIPGTSVSSGTYTPSGGSVARAAFGGKN